MVFNALAILCIVLVLGTGWVLVWKYRRTRDAGLLVLLVAFCIWPVVRSTIAKGLLNAMLDGTYSPSQIAAYWIYGCRVLELLLAAAAALLLYRHRPARAAGDTPGGDPG